VSKPFGWCGLIAVTVSALLGCGPDHEYVDEGRVCFFTRENKVSAFVVLEEHDLPKTNQSKSCTARFDGKAIQVTSNARHDDLDVDGAKPGPYGVACVLEGAVPAGDVEVRHGTYRAMQTFPVTATSCDESRK